MLVNSLKVKIMIQLLRLWKIMGKMEKSLFECLFDSENTLECIRDFVL